jgi:flagellar basal body-associated protein FliL
MMMLKGRKEFVAALVVIVIVLVTLALPYALTEAYGLKVKKLILLMQLVVLVVFSAGMLIWWLVRYRQTSHNIETLREEIERTKPSPEKLRTTRKREVSQNESDKKK